MSQPALPQRRAQRGALVLLLTPAALLLLSGAPIELDRTPGVSSGPVLERVDGQAINRILESENPLLSAPQRLRIAAAVLRYSAKYALAPELVTAVLIVESGARPWAQSAKGAMGLMQVMPHMMSPIGLAGNAATVESNIEAGCRILADNIRRWGEERGISAYFWGSRIGGGLYLQRVQDTRAALRERLRS